jgi:alkanesulfonate monooxygenase SsuD/methylene tetrahydromethanopterin reductase-like flavin-dependent oxidoreductase (luciferase family)
MRLGAILSPISDPHDPKALESQAKEFEAAGYESLWTVQAIGRGFTVTDPLIALAVAATATSLELGTAVLQLPLYEPMDLAHRIYSLMQLTSDRFVLGLGTGSTQSDFTAFKKNYRTRFVDFEKNLSELQDIFLNNGNADVTINHWKNLNPGPPIFLGTWGENVVKAAKEYSGWIASAHYRKPDEVIDALKIFRREGGKRAIVSTIQVARDCDLGELKEKLLKFSDAGFDDAVVIFLEGAPKLSEVRDLI